MDVDATDGQGEGMDQDVDSTAAASEEEEEEEFWSDEENDEEEAKRVLHSECSITT